MQKMKFKAQCFIMLCGYIIQTMFIVVVIRERIQRTGQGWKEKSENTNCYYTEKIMLHFKSNKLFGIQCRKTYQKFDMARQIR